MKGGKLIRSDEKLPAPSAGETKAKPRPKSFDGAALSRTAINAWTKPLPVAIRSPGCLSPPVQTEEHEESSSGLQAAEEETARFDATLERIEETLKRKDTLAPIPEQAESDSPLSRPTLKPVKQATILEPAPSPAASGHLEPPSAFSAFGTESDPATPWDPALQARKMADVDEQSDAAGLTAPAVLQNPAYPWGMPMSPLPLRGEVVPEYAWDAFVKENSFASLNGGAVWTPAGWTVPDAAAQYPKPLSRKKPKSYYRSELYRGEHLLIVQPSHASSSPRGGARTVNSARSESLDNTVPSGSRADAAACMRSLPRQAARTASGPYRRDTVPSRASSSTLREVAPTATRVIFCMSSWSPLKHRSYRSQRHGGPDHAGITRSDDVRSATRATLRMSTKAKTAARACGSPDTLQRVMNRTAGTEASL